MSNENATLGNASLWTAIIGIVVPGCLAVLVAVFYPRHLGNDPGPLYALCGVLFVILELVALGCGIAARRTATGIAGIVISGTLCALLFLGAALCLLTYLAWDSTD
jgi:hypothetical protein